MIEKKVTAQAEAGKLPVRETIQQIAHGFGKVPTREIIKALYLGLRNSCPMAGRKYANICCPLASPCNLCNGPAADIYVQAVQQQQLPVEM